MNNFNITINDLLLMMGVYFIQQNGMFIKLIGILLVTSISYIEIKKRQERKQKYNNIEIFRVSIKKDFNLYNKIIESINNNEYQKIDIMKTYNELLISINNLDYDFDKINNALDIFCFLATIDNILYYNKKGARIFILNGQEILDIYARLVNQIHNISIIKNNDLDNILLKKELNELYYKFNYNNIKIKVTIFCNTNNYNNIYQI